MTGAEIGAIISRELRALERELQAYGSDEQVWLQPAGLPNSAGTLALHAAGNLLHFVGGVLGHTGYVRDRDGEFSTRGVSRRELIAAIHRADSAVSAVLDTFPSERLQEPYPLPVANRRQLTGAFLLHLAAHLAYHLGQVDFHRRIVTGDVAGVGAVSPAELPGSAPIESVAQG
ncbi:MAG TPA: DinB family protein [Gemmatimonadaceae bacterium]